MTDAARAYDAVAAEYDGLFVERGRRIWSDVYLPYLSQGADVIDAGCGTGADTAIVARAGCRVRGFDVSPGMLQHAERRAQTDGLQLELQVARLEQIGDIYAAGSADVILSGFAALNTCDDLAAFGRGCARVLRPGGWVILHFLTPGGLYDRLGNLARGRVRIGLGSWREREVEVSVGTTRVTHRLLSPAQVEASCPADAFRPVARHGIGLLTPDDGPTRLPGTLVRRLDGLEERLRGVRLLATLGRFAVVVLQRR